MCHWLGNEEPCNEEESILAFQNLSAKTQVWKWTLCIQRLRYRPVTLFWSPSKLVEPILAKVQKQALLDIKLR